MKRNKIVALVLALLLVCGTFAACGSDSGSSTASTGSTASTASTAGGESSTADNTSEPATDTTATGDKNINAVATMEPTGLNTLKSTYSIEFSLIKHMYENLYMLDENDVPQPAAAESVDVSDDHSVFTFHLRDDGKWSNGDPVTANDFAFAWQQVLNPDVAADYAYFLFFIKNAEAYLGGECEWEDVGVKVIDDKTLEVTLDHAIPYAEFLFSFGTMAPINQKFYEEIGADQYNKDTGTFCTNGAFTLKEWNHNSNILLEKFQDWHDADKVQVETINWKIITKPQPALNEFLAGGVDIVGLGTGELIDQAKANGYEILSYPDGGAFYVYFNHKNEYLQNKNLRQALALAIDKQGLVDSVMKNDNKPMTSFTHPSVAGYDGNSFAEAVNKWNGGDLTPVNGDVEKAKEYFDTALSELGCTVEDLSANLSVDSSDDEFSTSIAAYYQEQWRQAFGLEVTVNPMPTKEGSANRSEGNYVMSMTGWGPDYNDPMTFLDLWVSTGGNNQTGYASEEYDKLYAEAGVETDFEKRQEIFYQMEKMIVEDLPVAPVYWRWSNYAINDQKIAGGVIRSTFQDINLVYTQLK